MKNTQLTPISISLPRQAHAHAQSFAAQQTNTSKGKQVYLNTLAVCAVADYLKWLQIETNLQKSDSWQPVLQLISDSADLLIPDVGRLECRPVLPQANYLTIPSTVTEERIGYVAVQFLETLDRVNLIGFLPAIESFSQSRQISLTQLKSLELLLENISKVATKAVIKTEERINVNLSQWWSKIFEPNWLSLETLLRENYLSIPALSIRTQKPEEKTDTSMDGVRRGKLINLGAKLGNNLVALIVTCTPIVKRFQNEEQDKLPHLPHQTRSENSPTSSLDGDSEIDVLLQVYPAKEQTYLPANLELMVSDEANRIIPELKAIARDADNCIQLSLSGFPGERFNVTLSLNEISFTENFRL